MFNFNAFFNTPERSRFYCPTKIFLGTDSRNILFEIIDSSEKILLVVDGFFEHDTFIKEIYAHFQNAPFPPVVVKTPPTTTFIDDILTVIPRRIDWIVAIGGGSTLDAAKALAAQMIYGKYKSIGYKEDRVLIEPKTEMRPKLMALPTTAGTGAEISRYYLIYDGQTREKVLGRSWAVVSDYSLLDSYFLRSSSHKLLALSAFDAFLHLWETYVCRCEISRFNVMLTLEGIPAILDCINAIRRNEVLSETVLLTLLYASTLGGVAISNVRTGNIHEAAGSLFEQVPELSHPETLTVFWEEAIKQYRGEIGEREKLLMGTINARGISNISSLDDLFALWKSIFKQFGVDEKIKKALLGKKKRITTVKSQIVARVMNDRVWDTKESPILLTHDLIESFVEKSLNFYLF